MRYLLTKTSDSYTIIIGDSQLKHLDFPNVNILSLLGAVIKDVVRFIPGNLKTVVLFNGGNDLFDGYLPSSTPIEEVAVELSCLADSPFDVASRVSVLGIPPRIPRSQNLNVLQRLWRNTSSPETAQWTEYYKDGCGNPCGVIGACRDEPFQGHT